MTLWFALAMACGKDACERAAKADEVCGVPHSNDETRACKDAVDECPRADQKALDDYAKCYAEAGGYECEPTDQQRYDVLACLSFLDDLSDDCVLPLELL